jgi:hypothetical protein
VTEETVLSGEPPQPDSRRMQLAQRKIANCLKFNGLTSFGRIETEYHVFAQKATEASFFKSLWRRIPRCLRGLQGIMLLHCARKKTGFTRFFSKNVIDLGEKLQYNGLRNSKGAVRIFTPHSASDFI